MRELNRLGLTISIDAGGGFPKLSPKIPPLRGCHKLG